MRERLDCAVLLTRCSVDWMEPLLGQHAGGRLHLHGFDTLVDISKEGAHAALASVSMVLRRHDVCLIPASPPTLSWVRTSLSQAMPQLRTPVMALVRDLTAAALHDLCELGLADFLREPFCGHEARVRIERLLDGRRAVSSATAGAATAGVAALLPHAVADPGLDKLSETVLYPDARVLEAYAVAAASRSTITRESFRDAKSKIIERFERAYITESLGRHAGNIAMAARAAQKHRRAFWALMRKHDIDAAPFRTQALSCGASLYGVRHSGLPSPQATGGVCHRIGEAAGAAGHFPAREG